MNFKPILSAASCCMPTPFTLIFVNVLQKNDSSSPFLWITCILYQMSLKVKIVSSRKLESPGIAGNMSTWSYSFRGTSGITSGFWSISRFWISLIKEKLLWRFWGTTYEWGTGDKMKKNKGIQAKENIVSLPERRSQII